MNSRSLIKILPYSIAFIYVLAGSAYILYSDKLVVEIANADLQKFQTIQTEKELYFVFISGLLLLLVVRRSMWLARNFQAKIDEKEQQKRARVAESEQKYSTLFSTIPHPIWIFDEDTLQIVQVNDAACRVYGYSHAEFEKMTLRELRHPDDLGTMERTMTVVRSNDRNKLPYPIKHCRKDGSAIYMMIENAKVYLNGKKYRLAIGSDTTEDLKLKQELTTSNERLRSAHKLSGMGYWTRNMATNEILWSPELYEIFGVDPNNFELTEANIARILSDNYENPVHLDLHEWKDSNELDHERHILRPDGTPRWIHEKILAHRSATGNIDSLEGIVMDITNQKEYEQQINESNERLRMVMRATVEAIIDWDIANDKVYLGNGFRQYFGYTEYENNYRIWADNIWHEDREYIFTTLRQQLEDPGADEIEAQYRFCKADGTVAWVSHKGICLRTPNGKATRVVSAMMDITRQREYVQQIENQNEALRHIAFVQSHVIRSPLATLMGLVTLLQDTATQTGEAAELLEGIQESAARLDDVIHTIVRNAEAAESQLPSVKN